MEFEAEWCENDIDPKVDVVATRNVKDLNMRKELTSVFQV
jgi:hypothetical protein